MKKALKYLAVILVLALVVGTIPVSAASKVSLKKSSKTLYVDGCSGTTAAGKAAKYYGKVKLSGFLSGYSSKKMQIKATSDDTDICKISNGYIIATGMGTAYVTVKVNDKSTEKSLLTKKIKVVVKKNSSADTFTVTGIKDGSEYQVGTKLTIKMPRNGIDTDLRALKCDKSSGVTLKKENSKGTTYTVKFTEPGDYKFTAYAYMSSKYKGVTAQKVINVSVAKASNPTATPVPTATPAPTAAPTPTPAAKGGAIKLVATNKFEITFDSDADKNAKAADFFVYTTVLDLKNRFSTVKDVKVSGKTITVEMSSDFVLGMKYGIDYLGGTYEVIGINATKDDIAYVGITKTDFQVAASEDVGVRYYNKDKVDITNKVAGSVTPKVTLVSNVLDGFADGTKLYYSKAGNDYKIKVSVTVNASKTIEDTFSINVTAPYVNDVIWSITDGDFTYLKKDDEQIHFFTKDDTNANLEALFVMSDGSVKTLTEAGVTTLRVGDELVMMNVGPNGHGGFKLVANNVGSSYVMFLDAKGNQVQNSIAIEVKGAKQATKIDYKFSKYTLNANPASNDSLKIYATVYDQYGRPMKDKTINVIQSSDSASNVGAVPFTAIGTSGETKVEGNLVALKPGVTAGTITGTLECGDLKESFSFNVGKYDTADVWSMAVESKNENYTMNTAVAPGDVAPESFTFSVQGMKQTSQGNFSVKKEMLKFYSGDYPAMNIATTARLGVGEGDIVYLYTVQKDGKYLTDTDVASLGGLVDYDFITNDLTLKSFVSGKKLQEGTYSIKTFKVKAGASISNVEFINGADIYAADSGVKVEVISKKSATSKTAGRDIIDDCFTIKINGETINAAMILDVSKNDSASNYYINTVKVGYTNTVYGLYELPIVIDTLVKKN